VHVDATLSDGAILHALLRSIDKVNRPTEGTGADVPQVASITRFNLRSFMKKSWLLVFALLHAVLSMQAATPQHTFELQNGKFQLDHRSFQILAGEIHYARIPRARWRYAMRMARAMGLNTVTTYVFWNLHEPEPERFDFSGQIDLPEFLKMAQEEGLYVVLRPGPYACAEWEFGGYPAWLLKDRTTVVRSLDPKFMVPAADWFQHLGAVIKPFLLANGGPIIAVQVENEYGSFGKDRAYMQAIYKLVMDSGMGGTTEHPTLLYTADGGVQQPDGSIPGLPAAVNFGPGDASGETARLRAFRPNGPPWVGEYWAGWFDHWGRNHAVTNTDTQVAEYESLLRQGYSINLYVLWGGTSFGWMNGANSDGKDYEPDVTSYDYDAPISERGEPREKYFKLRDAITRVTGIEPPPVPPISTASTFPINPAKESASLWDNLPKPISSPRPLTMEEIGQSYGYILYTTQLDASQSGLLVLDGLHDYASVYADRVLIGTVDRRLGQTSIEVSAAAKGHELAILVENTGRINYSIVLRNESKGVLNGVLLAGKELIGWFIFSLPMDHPENLHYRKSSCNGPCFFRTSFAVRSAAEDTFLDTTPIHKGVAWVNGVPLGRAWDAGPQATLLIPGSWINQGLNSLVVFDVQAHQLPALNTADHALWIACKDEPNKK
jgi:beta-galactosidase